VVILSGDHPVAAELELTVEHFTNLPHFKVSFSEDETDVIDDALAVRGLARLVSAKLPLHSLVSALIGSQALAVVPRRVAVDIVATSSMTMMPLPFPSPRVALYMIWHRRFDNHPAHRWLRGTLRASVAGV
jgi:DNA-binding transcriptional LysR family regulator